jgi:hypothetical protein
MTSTFLNSEARGRSAVDHAVVVGERKRQHQPGVEEIFSFFVLPRIYGSVCSTGNSQDRDFGRVDDRGERGTADAAQARDRERAALQVAGLELALARELADVGELVRDVEHALAVGVAHHRHHQPAGRVDRHAHVVVLLDDDVLARLVERRIEHRELPQRRDAGLDHEGEHRQLESLLLGFGGLRLAESLEIRDVGLVELGDVRNRDPVAVQIRPGQLLDARKRLRLHRAELGEVDFRPGGQIERKSSARLCADLSGRF